MFTLTCSLPMRLLTSVFFASFTVSLWSLPSQNISQVPLQLVTPGHAQVLIAIANSESMDGTLSGAIMTGSGSLSTTLSSLSNSSSPANYTVPAGFTPPVQAANSAGLAPYTVNQSGTLMDNSASRLNVAKAGVQAILQSYMGYTDFALATYSTGKASLYTTWVYYMSPTGANFSFSNTQSAGNRYVNNPCFGYLTASATVSSNCLSLASLFGASTLSNNRYMLIGSSSDDPNINDVLYASGGIPGIFATYNGPQPATPYPPNFTLANYNNNAVSLSYSNTNPDIGTFGTSPTNAGFVPFSPQVIYSERGFGYSASQSATTANIVVDMTSSGTTPTTTSINAAVNLFTPFLKPETNNSSSTEIKSVAGQSPMAGLLTKSLSYFNALPASGSCPAKRYIILISDGLPTLDLNAKSWPPLGSAAATGYGVTATFNANGSLSSTNDQALTDTINALTNLNKAGIKTFIVGLGSGVDPTLNPQAAAFLTAMAIAGGTVNYYPATSPSDLVNDLNNILIAVQNGDLSTTSAAVSSSHLTSTSAEYLASFNPSDTPYLDWTGDLLAISLDASTGFPTSKILWSAQTLLDTLVAGTGWSSSRLIATWNPTLNSGAGDGVPFEWANLSAAQQTLLQPSDSKGQSRLQYVRGSTAQEVRNGGTFRNRSHILGDIVDSQPLYVGVPSGPYLSLPSYLSFILAQANRQPMIYTGANDGMLHAFNASTGSEAFAYIPNAVFANLDNLTATTYNQSHLFFVNGSPQFFDVQFSDASWHTMLVGGEGAGGNSIYAIDITSPQNFNSETNLSNAVLWEFTDADMGLSYSEPQIAPISPGSTVKQTFAVFFGNGYNSATNKAILYVLNPQTGNILTKLDLCAAVSGACNASLPQGLSTVTVGNSDGLQGQPITQVYAGDLQGNMWAIDVSSTTIAQWKVRLLFQARDTSGKPQPITTAPLVTLHPIYPRLQGLFVMFGTGQLLTTNDLTNTQLETVYGVWDKPNANTVFNRANLQSQTLSVVSAATSGLAMDIITDTNNAIDWALNLGWYSDMLIGGQRLVSPAQLLNGAFVATLITPPANVCSANFTSIFLELNYKTGGAFARAQLDINGDSAITSADQYNGTFPVGIALAQGYATSATIIGPTSTNNMTKLITQARGNQSTIINPNNSPRITGWWQLP